MSPELTHNQDRKKDSRAAANQVADSMEGLASLQPPEFGLYSVNPNDNNQAPMQMRGSGILDSIGDFLNVRSNEAERDAYEDFLEAMEEKREFVAETHTKLNHMPSTGRGKFDVHYFPSENKLLIAIRYALNFINGSATDYPDASAADLRWTDEGRAHWERQMQRLIYTTWSGHFTFYCQKDFWENLSAATSVVAYKDDANPHYNFNVTKVPRLDSSGDLTFRGSAVTPPSSATEATNATFDSNDIESYDKLNTGRNLQTPIAHEAGHILGLGDEYPVTSSSGTPRNYTAADPTHMRSGYAHQDLVHEEFGADVTVGRDTRIMSSGDQVQPEHGVTFLEALKAATDMEEWGYNFKLPAPTPENPDRPEYNDAVVPSSDTMYA